ncbi:MAG: response regulator [Luteolibacter sp.]|uniref:response regulator transcription factor n=1 Tax=Luteolibacter sp. TaxID=1962973 RepID=UPI003263CCA0
MSPENPTVFIVDDDVSVLRSLSRLMRQVDYEPRTFASAEEFLSSPDAGLANSCLVLDLRMPGLGGLELQRKLASVPASCPVIFISGDGDIPSSVQAMKQGAVTFLSKPFENEDLLKAIDEALEVHRRSMIARKGKDAILERIRDLTERERDVMSHVISGELNKQIAFHLGISENTVKIHRGRVMAKMNVVSVAELVRHCEQAGFQAASI